jgi:hypothetical protein
VTRLHPTRESISLTESRSFKFGGNRQFLYAFHHVQHTTTQRYAFSQQLALHCVCTTLQLVSSSFVGCCALVQLLKNCLQKAIDGIPACDQVTELNELIELMILRNTLLVITDLTYRHVNSRVGITAIDGVEAVVKVVKTFPKCQTLQERACAAFATM